MLVISKTGHSLSLLIALQQEGICWGWLVVKDTVLSHSKQRSTWFKCLSVLSLRRHLVEVEAWALRRNESTQYLPSAPNPTTKLPLRLMASRDSSSIIWERHQVSKMDNATPICLDKEAVQARASLTRALKSLSHRSQST